MVCQASERQIRARTQELESSAGEHVRGLSGAWSSTARQPMDALPELGASLTHVRAFDDVRGAVENRAQLTIGESDMEGVTRFVREHLLRIAGIESDGIEV